VRGCPRRRLRLRRSGGTVGEEGFAGFFHDEVAGLREESVDGGALVFGDEEEVARTCAPGGAQLVVGEEEVGGVGECAAEEHRGGSTVDKEDGMSEVEGDRGAFCLVAV
jgi:hypothetical protein